MLTDRDFHDLDMADAMAEVATAKGLLAKLTVAELRVLARHYWKIDQREARTISKVVLVADLACENGEQILSDMWRSRK